MVDALDYRRLCCDGDELDSTTFRESAKRQKPRIKKIKLGGGLQPIRADSILGFTGVALQELYTPEELAIYRERQQN